MRGTGLVRDMRRLVRDFAIAFASVFLFIVMLNQGGDRSIPLPVLGLFTADAGWTLVRDLSLPVFSQFQSLSFSTIPQPFHTPMPAISPVAVTSLTLMFSCCMALTVWFVRTYASKMSIRRRGWS